MSDLQTQIKAHIESTDRLLATSPKVDDAAALLFENAYSHFLRCAWCLLPMSGADGSALATVASMPLWELLNQYTSTTSLATDSQKGFAVQMLTAMYPKSKDRRCMYQQLNCCGSNAQSALPLSTCIPVEFDAAQLPLSSAQKEYASAVQQIAKSARTGAFVEAKSVPATSATLRHFLDNVLPKCTIVESRCDLQSCTASEVTIVWDGGFQAAVSGCTFLLTLWNLLVAGEFLGIPESKQLLAFLRSSRWSSRIVALSGQKKSYAELLSPIIYCCALCVSLSPRSPSTAVDTIPLLEPRIVQRLCWSSRETLAQRREDSDEKHSEYAPIPLKTQTVSLNGKRVERLREQLESSISSEIEFMGTSSSCRDFDQLAYLCRDFLFLPAERNAAGRGVPMSHRCEAVFNRKRSRTGGVREGPCFIPVQSGLSDVMEKAGTNSQVTLERLCCKWKSE